MFFKDIQYSKINFQDQVIAGNTGVIIRQNKIKYYLKVLKIEGSRRQWDTYEQRFDSVWYERRMSGEMNTIEGNSFFDHRWSLRSLCLDGGAPCGAMITLIPKIKGTW